MVSIKSKFSDSIRRIILKYCRCLNPLFMKFIEYAKKLETVKYLAKHKRAGTPQELAQKLNVSPRTVQRMMQQLREQGCRIVFNRLRRSYEEETSGEEN